MPRKDSQYIDILDGGWAVYMGDGYMSLTQVEGDGRRKVGHTVVVSRDDLERILAAMP